MTRTTGRSFLFFLMTACVCGQQTPRAFFQTQHTDMVTIPAQPPFPAETLPKQIPASTNYATSFGGGIRYYASEHYGFRAEVKAYKPTGSLITQVFSRATFGFFYQF